MIPSNIGVRITRMNISTLASYMTPSDPFVRNREQFPFVFGDVFNNENQAEFTLFEISNGHAYGVMKDHQNRFYLKKFNKWLDLFDEGFKQNLEFLEKEKEIAELNLCAPRKLQDGTWAALSRLMFTTAICVDFDAITQYESRYCFSHNERLPSWCTATYWLAQFKTKNSLPIGNCAYRGKLGDEPIRPKKETDQYYADMLFLKHNPTLDNLDIFGIANREMLRILNAPEVKSNPKKLKDRAITSL